MTTTGDAADAADAAAAYYTVPRRVGAHVMWHTDDGWWSRQADATTSWSPMSAKLIKIVIAHHAVTQQAMRLRSQKGLL